MSGAVFSVREWCERNRISRGMFYKLARQGEAPRTFRVGLRRLISVEADAEWRRAREDSEKGDAE